MVYEYLSARLRQSDKIAKLLEVEVADLIRKDNIDWQQDNEIEKEYDEEGISSTV